MNRFLIFIGGAAIGVAAGYLAGYRIARANYNKELEEVRDFYDNETKNTNQYTAKDPKDVKEVKPVDSPSIVTPKVDISAIEKYKKHAKKYKDPEYITEQEYYENDTMEPVQLLYYGDDNRLTGLDDEIVDDDTVGADILKDLSDTMEESTVYVSNSTKCEKYEITIQPKANWSAVTGMED